MSTGTNNFAEKWLDPKVAQAIEKIELVSTVDAPNTKSIDNLEIISKGSLS